MDANQTKLHVVLGESDWSRWTPRPTLTSPLEPEPAAMWDANRNELTLRAKPFQFDAGKSTNGPTLGTPGDPESSDRRGAARDRRRGAARDRFGNWYFISEDRRGIVAHSAGCKNTQAFWRCDAFPKTSCKPGLFQASEPTIAPLPATLSGLAITVDHYLVVGTITTNERGGLLVFDLHAGGAPQLFCWPAQAKFGPFDIAARRGGGVLILDRQNCCYWILDRHLRVVLHDDTQPAELSPDVFQPIEGPNCHATPATPWKNAQGIPITAVDPVSIEELPDGSILILNAEQTQSTILRYVNGKQSGAPQQLAPAYDFAFAEGKLPLGYLFVVTLGGNQSSRFDLRIIEDQIQLTPTPDYYPMRLFTGMGVVAAGSSVFYDSNRRFVPLTYMDRVRYEESAEIISSLFDGREPACVWHRFLFDGCVPAETSVEIWSRACDEKDSLELAAWTREPAPYRRGNGSELPYSSSTHSSGTFEILFQKARGQFLQIKLILSGDGRATPHLRALRIYYPRFSYLTHYLPAVYREDSTSASFLDRLLANVEGTNTAIEDRIAAAQVLFDVRSAPSEALGWLGSWFGIALDPAWNEERQRLLLRNAMRFFQWRGTVHGLQMALRLAFDECVDDSIFDQPAPNNRDCSCNKNANRFRIIERFLLRQSPAVELGDPTYDADAPRPRNKERWTPSHGANELRERFQESTNRKDWNFELGEGGTAEETSARTSFAQGELGFMPSELIEDQQGWREFLKKRYVTIEAANTAHGVQTWTTFADIPLPTDQSTNAAALKDWRAYVTDAAPLPFAIKRRLWQDFLARRYSSVQQLQTKHGTHWQDFAWISYPTALPTNPWLLSDWYQFEALVLPTHEAAHRFSVLLPFTGNTNEAQEERAQALELARRIVEMEKPAHTTFDVKFYWALFRVGEARLGIDTTLGLGGRDSALLPPATLGQTYLAESQLTASHPLNVAERSVLGRDHLK